MRTLMDESLSDKTDFPVHSGRPQETSSRVAPKSLSYPPAIIRKLKPGDIFAAENERMPVIGIVLTGVLRVTQMRSDGRQQIVGLLLEASLVGRPFVQMSAYGIEAATEVTLQVYERARFEEFLVSDPTFERMILSKALDELDAARGWTALVGSHSIKERIAAFLLMCIPVAPPFLPQRADRDTLRIAVPIDRRDMAALLGTTPETISRFVRDLMRQGVIRIRNSRDFDLIEPATLRDLAGQASVTALTELSPCRGQTRVKGGEPSTDLSPRFARRSVESFSHA